MRLRSLRYRCLRGFGIRCGRLDGECDVENRGAFQPRHLTVGEPLQKPVGSQPEPVRQDGSSEEGERPETNSAEPERFQARGIKQPVEFAPCHRRWQLNG